MRTELLNEICVCICKSLQLPVGAVTGCSSMATIERWDSLQHLNVVMDLEEKFLVSFTPDEVVQLNSIEAIHSCLVSKLT